MGGWGRPNDYAITKILLVLLIRLDYENNEILKKEILIEDKIGRIRDFEIDKKGDIYLIVDEKNASLWKLSKK